MVFSVLWQLPNGDTLVELIVPSFESELCWSDIFNKVLSHGSLRNLVKSRANALNADVTPVGTFVKPVF